jgi:hypothetical protein
MSASNVYAEVNRPRASSKSATSSSRNGSPLCSVHAAAALVGNWNWNAEPLGNRRSPDFSAVADDRLQIEAHAHAARFGREQRFEETIRIG